MGKNIALTQKSISHLFDYQKIQKNERLAALIADTESRYENALSDDALAFVSAAGEPAPTAPPEEKP